MVGEPMEGCQGSLVFEGQGLRSHFESPREPPAEPETC